MFWARLAWEYANTPRSAIPVPTPLRRPTGVAKKKTEAMMTTTRLTQFPMECVTGLTRERIMYETCWYEWKQIPANTARLRMNLASRPSPVRYAWLKKAV